MDDAGSSTAGDAAVSESSVTLSRVDGIIIGWVFTWQAFAALICLHLIRWRKWPPYVTKNVTLVVIATVSGVMWTIATFLSLGFVSWEEGDFLANCVFENFMKWWTLCVHAGAFFIRVYRKWRILIKHDDNMWHAGYQVLLLSSPTVVPVAATWIVPRFGDFDENTRTCRGNNFVALGMHAVGFLLICFLWFVCARQLRMVRRQFNEYVSMKRTMLYMTITLASYALFIFLVDDTVLERRLALLYPLVTTYILLWGPIGEPLVKKMLGDDEYLWSFTKGFAELPSPAQLKASLAEQLSVKQLREEFRRYITARVAEELMDFYFDSLDREEVKGFFERQAITMRIVEQYIREGALNQVNISEKCRERVLETDVTALDIFDEARAEVLALMEANFQRGFAATVGFQRLLDASEEEQRELRILRAGGILPPGIAVTPSPAAAKSSAASSASAAGPSPQQESPFFFAGMVAQFWKLPRFVKNPKGAFEARRRRRDGGASGVAHFADAVSRDSIKASGSGAREDRGVAMDADLDMAPRPQSEEGGRVVEARHVAQSDVEGSQCKGDVERGEWNGPASRFEFYHSSCRYCGRQPGGARDDDTPATGGCSKEATDRTSAGAGGAS